MGHRCDAGVGGQVALAEAPENQGAERCSPNSWLRCASVRLRASDSSGVSEIDCDCACCGVPRGRKVSPAHPKVTRNTGR